MKVVSSSYAHADLGDNIRLHPTEADWRLLYLRKGSAVCSADSDDRRVSEKQMLIIPAGREVLIIPTEYYEHILVETAEPILPGKARIYLIHDLLDTCSSILWLTFQHLERKYRNYENITSSLMDVIRQFIISQVESGPNTDVIDLEQMLRMNFSNPGLKVENLIQRIPQTPSYTRRLFHKAYGCSPIAYLNKLRVNAAKILLMTQNIPINEVAAQCGFMDPKYFSRSFHSATGLSPSAFREKFKPVDNNVRRA